jgi:hypothetical protein
MQERHLSKLISDIRESLAHEAIYKAIRLALLLQPIFQFTVNIEKRPFAYYCGTIPDSALLLRL